MNKKIFFKIGTMLPAIALCFLAVSLNAAYNEFKVCPVLVQPHLDPDFKAYVSQVQYDPQAGAQLSTAADRSKSSNALIVFFKNAKFKPMSHCIMQLPAPFSSDTAGFLTQLKALSEQQSQGFKMDFAHSLNHAMMLDNSDFMFFKQIKIIGSAGNEIHFHERRADYPMQVCEYTFKFYGFGQEKPFDTIEDAQASIFAPDELIHEIYIELAAPCFVNDGTYSNFGLFELGVTAKRQEHTRIYLSHRCFRRDNSYVLENEEMRGATMARNGTCLCSGFNVVAQGRHTGAGKKQSTIVKELLAPDYKSTDYECITNYHKWVRLAKQNEQLDKRLEFVTMFHQVCGDAGRILKSTEELYASVLGGFKTAATIESLTPIFLGDLHCIERSTMGLHQELSKQKDSIVNLLKEAKKLFLCIGNLGFLIQNIDDESLAKIILKPENSKNEASVNEQIKFVKGIRDRYHAMKSMCQLINKNLIMPFMGEEADFLSDVVTADALIGKYKERFIQIFGKYVQEHMKKTISHAVADDTGFQGIVDYVGKAQDLNVMITCFEKFVHQMIGEKNCTRYLRLFRLKMLQELTERSSCSMIFSPAHQQLADFFEQGCKLCKLDIENNKQLLLFLTKACDETKKRHKRVTCLLRSKELLWLESRENNMKNVERMVDFRTIQLRSLEVLDNHKDLILILYEKSAIKKKEAADFKLIFEDKESRYRVALNVNEMVKEEKRKNEKEICVLEAAIQKIRHEIKNVCKSRLGITFKDIPAGFTFPAERAQEIIASGSDKQKAAFATMIILINQLHGFEKNIEDKKDYLIKFEANIIYVAETCAEMKKGFLQANREKCQLDALFASCQDDVKKIEADCLELEKTYHILDQSCKKQELEMEASKESVSRSEYEKIEEEKRLAGLENIAKMYELFIDFLSKPRDLAKDQSEQQ